MAKPAPPPATTCLCYPLAPLTVNALNVVCFCDSGYGLNVRWVLGPTETKVFDLLHSVSGPSFCPDVGLYCLQMSAICEPQLFLDSCESDEEMLSLAGVNNQHDSEQRTILQVF